MWRQNSFPGNFDSDQSISDVSGDLEDNSFSLNSNTKKEQRFLLQRLEILRGRDDVSSGRKTDSLSHENQSSFFVEDEVEMPDFPTEDGSVLSLRKESAHHPDEEIISDDEEDYALSNYSITSRARMVHKDNKLNNFKSEEQDEVHKLPMINKEAQALIHLNENALSSVSFSKANKSCEGVRGKLKPKFALHPKLHKDGHSQHFISAAGNVMSSKVDYVPQQLEPIENGSIENSDLEFFEDTTRRKNKKQLNILPGEVKAFQAGLVEHSMAELLDGLQDRNILLGGNSKMYERTKGKRVQFVVKKSISPAGDRIVDNEEPPEVVTTGSSGDDEASYRNLNLRNPEIKKQTMADRFQEAFAATSFSDEAGLVTATKISGIGLFGKLQQVMQCEKERDADFLQKIQMGASPNDESHSIVVKIVSRYLDAKLIICQCSVGEYIEGSQIFSDGGRRRTVIFSPKVCRDVDLEVGNLICIHPPWKEVEVMGGDESIILSTYFSQI